ncbi:MAG: 3-isopropylmalate dehydratase large subunit [Bacteroidales bacterium]|nr:3-isopropylmalate dehydratase large subunit [Bacteroidales bacterium]
MAGKTFAEKIFGADAGSIVFAKPDIVLSHDNTSSIEKIFKKMKGEKVLHPEQLMVVLDHNAPPTTSKLANDYQQIRQFSSGQKISRFHDVGEGICHQLMADYARPGMIIVGSDSHTCTAGAFNAFAAGIDRTETAGLWMKGETWFRVPESIKITLTGKLNPGVYAKDVALYIMGMIGSGGADYMSVEYHGEGLKGLSIEDRMTIANLASEMGAKNAVFPDDEVLKDYLWNGHVGIEADPDASYRREIEIDMGVVFPMVACPHHVDNVKTVAEVEGTQIMQALIGTCTNGRMEDLRVAAAIVNGHLVDRSVQLLIAPASKKIYLQAIQEGLIQIFLEAGANILSPSCGPCLGTGQGIPADGSVVISTANRNFLGRMGNRNASIYLASPATVALSAIRGAITGPATNDQTYPYRIEQTPTVEVAESEDRRKGRVWDYRDADNLNTDQMFAGNLTYEINSSEPEKIVQHLFKGFDKAFSENVRHGDILVCGENFGCGSSREHPSVGLAFIGVEAVIVKSVSRIFFRSAINQGLPVLVCPDAVKAYQPGDEISINLEEGRIRVGDHSFSIPVLPEKLREILDLGGLVNWISSGEEVQI